jgi:hypothetical protein
MNSQADSWNWRLAFTGTNTRVTANHYSRARRAHISLPQSDVPICLHAALPNVYNTQTENGAKHWGRQSLMWASERTRDANQVISLCAVCAQNCRGPLAAHNTHTKHACTCPYISPLGSYSNWNCWWVSRWRAQWPAAAASTQASISLPAPRYSKWMNVCGARQPFDAFALWSECVCVARGATWVHMRLFMFPLWEALGATRWDTKEVTRVTKLHWTGKRISPRRIIYGWTHTFSCLSNVRGYRDGFNDDKMITMRTSLHFSKQMFTG